jgi:nitroreductase/NAD-dependent dihydropyrimidine dehydrogenase PreA subunit
LIKIDENKCIGCGACASECLPTAIIMKDKKPVVRNRICIECSHCVSVCPVDAVEMIDYNREEVVEYNKATFDIDPENMLNTIKFRRSIRHFKNKEVEKEKLDNILEAGRYTPTASNKQATRYIVLDKELEDIKVMAMKGLHNLAVNHGDKEPMKSSAVYRKKFEKMYDDYVETGVDMLFYNAPMAIVVVVDESQSGVFARIDGGLAASNMELMANTQGLGMCHIGFFLRAVGFIPELQEKLGLKEGEAIATTVVLGYPDVKYKRGANRKVINVTMK